MKINFVLPGVGIGGGVRVVFEYANRLKKWGHDVTIIYPTVPPRMADRWFSPWQRGTQLYGTLKRLKSSNTISWFNLDVPTRQIPTLSPKLVPHFGRLIPDADITIATGWQTAYTVAALDDSKGEKVYFVQHYEIWETWNSNEAWEQVEAYTDDPASYPIEMYEVTPSNAKARREKALVDASYKLPLTKITISSWLENLLESKFDQRVAGVIQNSVNHSVFYPEDTSNNKNITLLLPNRDAVWKGRRETKKLIEKIGKLTNVDIHTFGPGSGANAYPEYVYQHGTVSDDRLRHLYSNADIFVLPSWTEGSGLPPLEAMACKSAVVTTNVGAVPDFAEDGINALIVPSRDSKELIEAVHKLIENPDKRHYLQENAHNHVKKYTWEEATSQFEETIREISSMSH